MIFFRKRKGFFHLAAKGPAVACLETLYDRLQVVFDWR
jgi:hypothetical protein